MKTLRILLHLCSSAFLGVCFFAPAARAQCPARTIIAETLHNADGTLAEGRIVVAWQTFSIGACQVPAGQVTAPITAGALSIQLYPNDAALPGGTSYRATYHLKSGRVSTEYWVVPSSGAPVGLAAVRSATVPVPNVMFSQSQVTNLAGDLAKKVELPSPCPAGKFLQANGASTPPQVDCVDGTGGGGGGSGTVTSVALTAPAQFSVGGSPVTSSGTLALGWANQSANVLLAGPASGGAAAPAFRALVAGDVPALDASKITSGVFSDARVDDGITLANLTQVTTRSFADLQNIPSAFAPAAHALTGSAHTASGLTTGHYLRANSATAFGFAQINFTELGGSIGASQQNNPGAGAKGGVEAKTCSGTDKLSAIGTDGVPVCSADQTGGGAAHEMLSATHSDSAVAAVQRGAGIFGIGASPAWSRVTLSATDRYFKRNASGDIVESSSAAAGTGTCTNQFVRAANADAAPTCSAVALASDVSGTLPVANGGTGATSTATARGNLGVRAVLQGGHSANFGPNSNSTYFVGIVTPDSSPADNYRHYVVSPVAGTVESVCVMTFVAGTLGSSQSVTFVLRKNKSTDSAESGTQQWTATDNAPMCWNLTTAFTVAAGDALTLKFTTPTWTTTPTQVQIRWAARILQNQ